MHKKVTVAQYDPRWKEEFVTEKKQIKKILGKNCIAIYHVGSTAVKDLASRPIIDILAVVKDISSLESVYTELECLGYICCGEMGIEDRRYFCKGGDTLTHTLQIFSASAKEQINRHIALRDYLINHREKAKEYSKLKTDLAALCTEVDCKKYADGKSEFLAKAEKDALLWYEAEQRRVSFMSIGMCLGMSLGMCLGSVFGNIGTGMCMGMCIGMGIGIALGSYKKS